MKLRLLGIPLWQRLELQLVGNLLSCLGLYPMTMPALLDWRHLRKLHPTQIWKQRVRLHLTSTTLQLLKRTAEDGFVMEAWNWACHQLLFVSGA